MLYILHGQTSKIWRHSSYIPEVVDNVLPGVMAAWVVPVWPPGPVDIDDVWPAAVLNVVPGVKVLLPTQAVVVLVTV